jgi:hypothetical protein
MKKKKEKKEEKKKRKLIKKLIKKYGPGFQVIWRKKMEINNESIKMDS